MPDLAVIVVGMDGWEQYTLPAIRSIQKHNPEARLFVMDCGVTPYPQTEGATIVRLEKSPSYAYALNQGVKAAGKADWYLMLNNDIIQHEPLKVDGLDPNYLYGRRILGENGHTWLELWLALIPYWAWYTVGEWDEGFLVCGFEDADYCIRAKALGFGTRHLPLKITHLWGKTRWAIPDYKNTREKNLDYFAFKWGWRPEKVKVISD